MGDEMAALRSVVGMNQAKLQEELFWDIHGLVLSRSGFSKLLF